MKISPPLFAAAFVAVAFAAASPAAAQAFNCRYAKLPAEMAICNDSELASADEEMASEYARLINTSPAWASAQIQDEQRDWLKGRNACGYDMQCIMGEYRWRFQQFGEWRDRLGE